MPIGYKQTEEHIRKRNPKEKGEKHSIMMKGNHYTKGKHWKIKDTSKYTGANGFKKGQKSWNSGKIGIYSKEILKKMSETRKGKKHSEETRKKMSRIAKKSGRKPPIKYGKDNNLWKGGISCEPYSPAWTQELRQAIRQRENFICQVCGNYPVFSVHHINYDKKNCEPDNLVVLCRKCHAKTNFNRAYWINYFRNLCIKIPL